LVYTKKYKVKKERKAILVQWHNNKLYFSDDLKKRIIEDYLFGNEAKREVYSGYT
jgi:hypothetical protein